MDYTELPPGFEIVEDNDMLAVKQKGTYLPLGKEDIQEWQKGRIASLYQHCWSLYRKQQAIPFEEYTKITQIVPASPGWKAVFLHSDKDGFVDTHRQVVCWAHVEISDGPYVRDMVVGMMASDGDTMYALALIGPDDKAFLGYMYPGDEMDWKQEAYFRVNQYPELIGYTHEEIEDLYREEAARQSEIRKTQRPDEKDVGAE